MTLLLCCQPPNRARSVLGVLLLAGLVGLPVGLVADDEVEGPPKPAFLVLPYLQLPSPKTMQVMWETNYELPSRVEFGTTRELGRTAEVKAATDLHEVALNDLQPDTTYYYRVRSGDLVSDIYSFKSSPPLGTKKWRMALYGDSRSNPTMHTRIAEQIAKANVQLIVHTGDIVLNGKNRASWRDEFFEPLGPLARSVPWLATIGNHENDSDHFFSYVAVPDSQRYFGLDFASAHVICLDSNAWIEKGRDSEQYGWLAGHLKENRAATWTFVAFHHPLFSAMASRPINGLRWDWAPLLLDPKNRIDGVLAGHDHFYARNYRMGRLGSEPLPGVFFATSAGGGAFLYRTKERDYIAYAKAAHHFTLFEFDGEVAKVSAIDSNGKIFDTYKLTKKPTAADEFCAYEIEELRQNLRLALSSTPGVRTTEGQATKIDSQLRVPIRFQVPVEGEFLWKTVEGWKVKAEKTAFRIEANQPLIIPLQAEVAPGPFVGSPTLTIQFAAGRFRNRTIELAPFKLTGPEEIKATVAKKPPVIDGKLGDDVWSTATVHSLIGLPPLGGRSDGVQVAADKDRIYVAARLDDPTGKVKVTAANPKAERSRMILYDEHVRVTVSDGKKTRTFAVSPEQVRYCSVDGSEDAETNWQGAAAQGKAAWTVEMAIPRNLFPADAKLRINVAHHQGGYRGLVFELGPTYHLGDSPDVIPDWRSGDDVASHAKLLLN